MSITSLVFFFWMIAGTTAPIAYEPYSEMGLQPPAHCEAFVIGPQGDILCTEAAVYSEDLTRAESGTASVARAKGSDISQ